MDTSPVVFLFDADAKGVPSYYGGLFDPAFLRALLDVDSEGLTNSRVLRGDALVSELTGRITAVEVSGKTSSYRVVNDRDTFATIVWDFADAIVDQWHTIDEEAFPLVFGRHNVYCTCLPTSSRQLASKIDRKLRGLAGYLGAIELDLGNPLQKYAFMDCLVDYELIQDGQVLMEMSIEGEPNTPLEEAERFPRSVAHLPYGTLDKLTPKPDCPDDLSERGRLSVERYQGKRRYTLQERVTAALARANPIRSSGQNFAFDISGPSTGPLEADLPEAKFVKYLLDANHSQNKGKAKFYHDTLSINPEDWRYLAAQFHDGLKTANLVELKIKSFDIDRFGASFNAIIPVRGLNGATALIDTNWIMEPGRLPRLSTAVPAKGRAGQMATPPPIVDRELEGDQRWTALFQMARDAGAFAARAVVPTPMRIQGFPINMEGLCGNAWIRVAPEHEFTQWLIKTGQVHRYDREYAMIAAQAPTSSIDRAVAYANAFALVLHHNGVDCDVENCLT